MSEELRPKKGRPSGSTKKADAPKKKPTAGIAQILPGADYLILKLSQREQLVLNERLRSSCTHVVNNPDLVPEKIIFNETKTEMTKTEFLTICKKLVS